MSHSCVLCIIFIFFCYSFYFIPCCCPSLLHIHTLLSGYFLNGAIVSNDFGMRLNNASELVFFFFFFLFFFFFILVIVFIVQWQSWHQNYISSMKWSSTCGYIFNRNNRLFSGYISVYIVLCVNVFGLLTKECHHYLDTITWRDNSWSPNQMGPMRAELSYSPCTDMSRVLSHVDCVHKTFQQFSFRINAK